MEIEKLKLYKDSEWNDLKIRFCGHSECFPLHSYGPGSRPYYLLHFVISGKGKLIVNKNEYLLETGQLFLVEPNKIVFYQADEKDPWTYSWVGFHGDLASYFMNSIGLSYPALKKSITAENFEEIKKLLNDILKKDIDSTINHLYINGLFLILLSKIGSENRDKKIVEACEKTSDTNYVKEAISIVEEFYGTELSVNNIADKLHINRSYLSNIFIKSTGMSLKKYLVNFRITQSEEFLFTTNWSIDYISKICGFNTPSYFSKLFKKYNGMSPSDYRLQRHNRRKNLN